MWARRPQFWRSGQGIECVWMEQDMKMKSNCLLSHVSRPWGPPTELMVPLHHNSDTHLGPKFCYPAENNWKCRASQEKVNTLGCWFSSYLPNQWHRMGVLQLPQDLKAMPFKEMKSMAASVVHVSAIQKPEMVSNVQIYKATVELLQKIMLASLGQWEPSRDYWHLNFTLCLYKFVFRCVQVMPPCSAM